MKSGKSLVTSAPSSDSGARAPEGSGELVQHVLPGANRDLGIMCCEVGLGQCDPQVGTFGHLIAGIADALSLAAVGGPQAFFLSCAGVLQIENALLSVQPVSIVHVQLRG